MSTPVFRNPVSYFELPVRNMVRARTFYEFVFRVRLELVEIDGTEMALFPFADGAPGASGALAKGDSYVPAEAGARVYFTVDDIDATMRDVLVAGGVQHYPVTEVPSYGWVAEFLDTEGNVVALHAARRPAPPLDALSLWPDRPTCPTPAPRFRDHAETRPISVLSAERYTWGAGADGWHLVRAEGLSVIQERMPPGTSEERHRHAHARQFFFLLAGRLDIEVEGTIHSLRPIEGLEVMPQLAHTVRNRGTEPAEFLVISQPPSQSDHTAAPGPDVRTDEH